MIPKSFQEDASNLARPIFTPANPTNMSSFVLFGHPSL